MTKTVIYDGIDDKRGVIKAKLHRDELTTLPAKPTNRERLLQAFYDIGLVTEADFYEKTQQTMLFIRSQFERVVKIAQWFDFGRVTSEVGYDGEGTANQFVHQGLFLLPYPECIFRVRLALNDPEVGPYEVELVFMCYTYEGRAIIVPIKVSGDHGQTLQVQLAMRIETSRITGAGADDTLAKVMFRIFSGLWLMLNAKNIKTDIDVPAEKLNRARAKAGKSPLSPVYRVHSAQYITALKETQRMEREPTQQGQGERASPKMHLRRAHLRHIKTKDKPIAIHAMIINGGDWIAPARDRYEVKA